MGIEKDIQQKAFRNDYNKAMVNIIYSSNWLHEKIKVFLDSEDITNQQYNILRILRGSSHPLSTLQIRERMLDKMSDTSRIVDRMLKKGLVEKTVCPGDKRMVDVILTPMGKSVLDKLDQRNAELDSFMNGLSHVETSMLNELLDKMRDSFSPTSVDYSSTDHHSSTLNGVSHL